VVCMRVGGSSWAFVPVIQYYEAPDIV
jgi:hypothetical protein